MHKSKTNVTYKLIKEEGEHHDRTFTVKVECDNKYAIAIEKSKKKAEKLAAQKYIEEQNIKLEHKKRKKNHFKERKAAACASFKGKGNKCIEKFIYSF